MGRGASPGGGVTRGAVKRGVGEIGEALPVADEASRFRGSAPIGGHKSGRESVGTTVGNRWPLRAVCKKSAGRATARVAPTAGLQEVRGRAESPSHGFAVPAPLGKGTEGTGGTDCHSQCAHWLRNDMVFARNAVWRATARVAPTEGLQEVRGERNHPVTASPCQPPLGKGTEEDGRKQRVFDAIKPPPGAGALEGVCGEGGLRRGGYSALAGFGISPPYGRQPQRWR